MRREIALRLNPSLYTEIQGTTDSELMFLLAVHFGLERDVHEGVARMAGLVESLCREKGIEDPLQMTLGISDGTRIYAFRYSSVGDSRTLYVSESVSALRDVIPDEYRDRFDKYTAEARAVVSEPFHDLPNAWLPVPESSMLTVDSGRIEQRDFAPLDP